MGFEVLNRRGSRASGVGVNVTKSKGSAKGQGLSGSFRIGPDVVEKAGWKNPDDMRVTIMIGTDKDQGTFLIKPDPNGKTKPFKPKAGASLQVSFSAMSAGFKAPTDGTQALDYDIQPKGVVLVRVPELKASGRKRS